MYYVKLHELIYGYICFEASTGHLKLKRDILFFLTRNSSDFYSRQVFLSRLIKRVSFVSKSSFYFLELDRNGLTILNQIFFLFSFFFVVVALISTNCTGRQVLLSMRTLFDDDSSKMAVDVKSQKENYSFYRPYFCNFQRLCWQCVCKLSF